MARGSGAPAAVGAESRTLDLQLLFLLYLAHYNKVLYTYVLYKGHCFVLFLLAVLHCTTLYLALIHPQSVRRHRVQPRHYVGMPSTMCFLQCVSIQYCTHYDVSIRHCVQGRSSKPQSSSALSTLYALYQHCTHCISTVSMLHCHELVHPRSTVQCTPKPTACTCPLDPYLSYNP